jgi:hypothetical protein
VQRFFNGSQNNDFVATVSRRVTLAYILPSEREKMLPSEREKMATWNAILDRSSTNGALQFR